jgi:hypothetical protein
MMLLALYSYAAHAQVVGGQAALEFLALPNAPHISALGGECVASTDEDIAFALQNPSLMRPALHNELELNYNDYYAGISIANLQYGYHVPELNTSFFLGIQYINYGDFEHTDVSGNDLGSFQARDFSIAAGASRSYGDHWRYGADIKFAYSTLYTSIASGIMTDVGVNYYDSSLFGDLGLWDFGVTAKTMGFMASRYTQTVPTEPLPFDLQMSAVKQFEHIPLRIIATIHNFYEWNIAYNNPADATANALSGTTVDTTIHSASFGQNLFRHFIFAAELTLAKRLTLTASYNYERRQEMELSNMPAMAGIAFGLGLELNKFQIHYARSYYSIAGAYNELSITMKLNRLMKIGNLGDRIHWNKTYADWEMNNEN